ncbi:MAG: hydrogenase maturation nickel metallochaperone HypA [Bernardetiaceae bacterium]|jgi:hydrogenase nickel incorporation protein HypA/HybF|nr:hydrogenase maturation nickel metallochaperone HypA [Bernardetiaceae bacterium]
MHEASLVRSIFRSLEDNFPPERLAVLERVYLRVGLLANVEPVLMQNAFAAVQATEARYETVELVIEVLPIKVFCPTCQIESLVENYRFVCACGRPSSQVVQGTELLIHQVEFRE